MAKPNPIPQGYTTVTPSLMFRDASKAIDFYKRAFGAQERMVMKGPDGKVAHAEVLIGNSIVMLADEMQGFRAVESLGGSPVSFYLYFEDADAAFQKAIAAGAKAMMPVTDMFWGDRMGHLTDPFGFGWNIASHVKDVTPEEMKKGQEEFMKQMAGSR